MATHLLASGLTPALATRAAALVEAAFMGLQLDGPLARPEVVAVSVRDLADAVAGLGAA